MSKFANAIAWVSSWQHSSTRGDYLEWQKGHCQRLLTLHAQIGLYFLWLDSSIKLQGTNQGWLRRARWYWIWLWFKWDVRGGWVFLLFLYTKVNFALLGIMWKLHFGLTAPVLSWFPGVHCQINVRGSLQVRSCTHVILYHSMVVWNYYYEAVLQIKVSISHLWLL